MRKVSESQLKRLKKKGKVRKKMGAQPERESPAPVAKDGEGMSGSKPTEQPAPALTPPPPPAPAAAPEPMASMSASMAVRDGLLEKVIDNNTRAISEFRLALETQKPRAGVGYEHTVKRGKDKLIDKVISLPIPMES